MEDITTEIQCAIDSTAQLNVRAFTNGKNTFTDDPRSIHMLRSGLIVAVVKMSSQEIKVSDEAKYLKWLNREEILLPKFGWNEGKYLWVSPAIYRTYGREQTIAKLMIILKRKA